MVQLSKKLIRLKSKGGSILYPELGDKTVTREKLVEGNAIPIIVTAEEELDNDYIKKYDESFAGLKNLCDESIYLSIKEITSSNIENYKVKFQNGTLIFLYLGNGLIPISVFNDDIVCTNPFIIMGEKGDHKIGFFIGGIIDDKLILKASFTYFYAATTNQLIYQSISFDNSDYTTVTVPPNRRMYYYDSEAESSGNPKYSMGVHGDVTFNLDLPEDYVDSDTVSYHIELWEYKSGRIIKFPENINFQITPITAFDATSSTNDEAQIQPEVAIDSSAGTKIAVEDSSNSGSDKNYHMIIDIFFNGEYYLGTIKVIPMVEFSTMAKDSKIKFVFSKSDSASYSDIFPSSGIIGDNGLLYTSDAGEFTYTYKGTKYTPGITIDQYNPINKVIKIYN